MFACQPKKPKMKLLRRMFSRKTVVVANNTSNSKSSPPEAAPVAGTANKDDEHDAHFVDVAKKFFNSITAGDVGGMKQWCHEQCVMHFLDIEMVPADMAEEVMKAYAAFPDAYFDFLEESLVEPNMVKLKLRWTGTHTGAPYGFGPYEPVPAKGTRVVNDPERVTLTFQDGLIRKCHVVPDGPNTGWHGVYQAIGGLIM